MFQKNQKKIILDVRPAIQKVREKLPVMRPEVHKEPPRKVKKVFWAPSRKIQGTLIFLCIALVIFYIWWMAQLRIVITPQRTAFDLGNGLSLAFQGEEFSTEIRKKGEGTSENTEQYSKQAGGTIVIFNDFSPEPQILVRRTRFRTPGGLIFRTERKITVPGKENGKPGSVEVEVVADEPGEKYNIDLSDFTIPGFEDTPKYTKIYGRAKTKMTGGVIGEGKVVGRKESDELLRQLEADVRDEYGTALAKVIPENYMILPSKYDLDITVRRTEPEVGSPGNVFTGEVVARVHTVAVNKNAYEDAVKAALLKDEGRRRIYRIDEKSNITFSNIVVNYAAKTVSVTMEGKVQFVGAFDVNELRNKIRAANGSSELDGIFESYPGIVKVEKTFRPAFLKRIPWREGGLIIEIL